MSTYREKTVGNFIGKTEETHADERRRQKDRQARNSGRLRCWICRSAHRGYSPFTDHIRPVVIRAMHKTVTGPKMSYSEWQKSRKMISTRRRQVYRQIAQDDWNDWNDWNDRNDRNDRNDWNDRQNNTRLSYTC